VEVLVLATGSSGNATLIRSGETAVLVDAGISRAAIRARLEQLGSSLEEVRAVFVTHEHSDHVGGLSVLSRRHPCPVWATAGTWSALPVRCDSGGELQSGRELEVGGLRVLPVATCHDSREPVALVVDDGRHRVGLCTDTGILTPLLLQRLAGCHLLLLEANHDADLLRNGPYPWHLKQRIASRHGHLANHQSEEGLARLRWPGLAAVVGLHLSEENNRADLARAAIERGVGDSVRAEALTRHEMARLVLGADSLELTRAPVPTRNDR
jgi:phosphoribosyl 1,2-cyclic phosphodiesterase